MKIWFSAAMGFVLAFALVISSGFRSAGSTPSWPPEPRFIVNWLAYEELGPATITLPPLGELVVFQVPSDRWLVVTGLGAYLLSLHVVERLNGQDVVKSVWEGMAAGFGGGGDTLGLTFRPGSEVVLVSTIPYPQDIDPRWFGLTGYLGR